MALLYLLGFVLFCSRLSLWSQPNSLGHTDFESLDTNSCHDQPVLVVLHFLLVQGCHQGEKSRGHGSLIQPPPSRSPPCAREPAEPGVQRSVLKQGQPEGDNGKHSRGDGAKEGVATSGGGGRQKCLERTPLVLEGGGWETAATAGAAGGAGGPQKMRLGGTVRTARSLECTTCSCVDD